jgi:hypothetical protein
MHRAHARGAAGVTGFPAVCDLARKETHATALREVPKVGQGDGQGRRGDPVAWGAEDPHATCDVRLEPFTLSTERHILDARPKRTAHRVQK